MKIARFMLFIITTIALSLPAASALSSPQESHASHGGEAPSDLVLKVRQVTAHFREVRMATAAGYQQFLGCVSGPQAGAMGVHFVNGVLVGDGELDVNRPEALIYEYKNGGASLVGVEYIVMAEDWHAHHKEPPVLEGQVFQYNSSPNRYGLPAFYELHVWAWRDNPNGAFVDWNPQVSCSGN